MINKKYFRLQIILLSMLLLVGQFAVVVHSVEHLSHAEGPSCQIFVQCEKSGNGIFAHALQLAPLVRHVFSHNKLVDLRFFSAQTSYYARAPPSFS